MGAMPVILRRDHIAGGTFVVGGLLVYALSGDLPFGSIAMPGAGMMPKLALTLMVVFGLILVLRANDGPAFGEIAWGDLPHAAGVVVAAAAAIALYELLGFLITMTLMMFGVLFILEKRKFWRSAVFSIGVSGLAYWMFGTLLKSPLAQGIWGF
jgi:Tripartite tricarboxylate transporter TctB family